VGAGIAGLVGWATNTAFPIDAPTDYSVFVDAGDALWRGDLAGVFADPSVQSGPLTVASLSGLDQVAGLLGHPAIVASLAMAVLASACLTLAIRFRQVVASPELAGAGLLVAWTLAALWGPLTGTWAHPTHALVPLLWLVCVREAQSRRALHAGLALGVALALDTWAVFGVCALLVLLPDVRALVRSAAVTIAVAGLAWGPFLVIGTGSGRMTWRALPGSLPDLLGVGDVGAGYRALQVVVVLVAGGALVVALRHSTDLAWLLPTVLVAVRIVTDGIYLDYYSFPVRAGLLVGVAVLLGRRDRRAGLVAVAAWLTSLELGTATYLVTHLPLVVGVVLAVVVVARPGMVNRSDDGQAESRAIAASASE
jgi:hypothetical protein